MHSFALALHGGAGNIPKDLSAERLRDIEDALAAALDLGSAQLAVGAAALDVVEAVVSFLEDAPEFNAGRGAVLNRNGDIELDAAVMDGHTRGCGAVCGLSTVRHPVQLARQVMSRTPYILFAGAAAEELATRFGLERVERDYFVTPHRVEEWRASFGRMDGNGGTVGAVACDAVGHLAAATSTGGRLNKWPGRVSDSAIIGAGTFASDDSCAVSATGIGEEFVRHHVAGRLAGLVRDCGWSLERASSYLVHEVLRPRDGGLICVNAQRQVFMPFSTTGMYRASVDGEGRRMIAARE